jgi:signal transduction histidine kinase/ActR/RegA family two-component response regulator
MFKGSLPRKLLVVMLLTTLVAVVVALGAMVALDLRAYHRSWIADVNAQAELLARTTAPALAFDDAKVANENLALLRLQPKVRAAAIYEADGRRFATYGEAADVQALPALPEADGTRVQGSDVGVFKRIVENGQILGSVYLRADYELYDRLLDYAGIALAVTVVAMLAALLVSFWLRRIVTRPILSMGEVAREVVRQRDYSRRVDGAGNDEVGALAEAFNAMLAEIEQRTQALEASNSEKAREVEERRTAQNEVMRLNAELEERVRVRTLQLETSNHELALASEAANKANRAKSEFLSNMSHELRTPLNAILGFGQLLAAESTPATPEQRRGFAQHVVRAGNHLLTLITEILNLAQIESGKLSLSVEPVRLSEVLLDCRTMTEPLAERRGIRLLFPSEDAGMRVVADRTRLKQVLLNLLSNAIKYNREKGVVVVDWQRLAADRLRLSVQDTGMGMSAEQLQSLFEPFNRLGRELGAEEGTGIGLVVTKRLVELMGGTITVSSTPGMGSVFSIELNLSATEQSLPQPPPLPEAAAQPQPQPQPHDDDVATVLCVEDNPASLQLVEQVLAGRPDLRLLSAPDGRIGVEMARAHRPDIILMDNNMPSMSGREAQAVLRNDPATAQIPIIALTANAMPDAVKQGLAAGFFRYLTKPVDVSELVSAIDSALAESRARRGY